MRAVHLPWLLTLAAAIGFVAADRAWGFQFGLRTYWPVLALFYLVVRLIVELRDPQGHNSKG
ncbi:MAG TPA: hypothetical protein VEI97_07775 [bacterium]|nr:hypothetical protein [bacterium]